MQMKAAMAMEKASESEGGAGDGMGMGMGLMMPAMFAKFFAGGAGGQTQGGAASQAPEAEYSCPECKSPMPENAKFCPMCGHQQLVFKQCEACGKNLTPNAKFCSRCGKPAEDKPAPKICSTCGIEGLADAVFCNQCGEKY